MPVDYMNIDETQGLLGDFDGTVIDAYWATPRQDSQGKATFDGADTTKQYWLVRIDHVHQEFDKVIPETMSINWGIGDKWHKVPEAPHLVRHEDDPGDEAVESGKAKPIFFKAGSALAKFVGLCTGRYDSYYTGLPVDPLVEEPMVLDDGGPVEYGLYPVRANFADRGVVADSRDASIWIGMKFRFRGLGFSYRQTKGVPPFTVRPVYFLGYEEIAPDAGRNGVPSASGAGVVVSAADVASALPEGLVGEVDEVACDEVATLLSSASSHTEFMRGALRTEMSKSNADVKAWFMDEDGAWAVKANAASQPAES